MKGYKKQLIGTLMKKINYQIKLFQGVFAMTEKKEKLLRPCRMGLLAIIFLIFFIPATGESDNNTPGVPGISQLGDPWYDERAVTEDLLFPQATYLFDYGDPTAAEQAHLEVLNRARLNPVAEAARLGIDLFEGVPSGAISGLPVQPVVFNAKLIQAARLHSQDMIDQDYFAHYSLNGKSPFDRMADAGYQYSTAGENLAFIGSTGFIDEVTTVLGHHDNLFIDENYPDRGHRVNILKENFKEVGVGVAFGDYKGYSYSYMLTCDFGTALQFSGSFILGAVYDDKDGDNFYDAGEGISNVSIELVSTGDSTVTATAGGYGIPVTAGNYTVKATLSDGSIAQQQVIIGSENKKIDFLKSAFGSGTAGPTQVGASAGIHNISVSASQALSLLVNVTNSAGVTPTYEWIWAMMGSSGDVYALTGAGWQMLTATSSLSSLAYDHGASTTYSIGNFSMADLGLSSGDSLIYGYAYATGSVFNLVVENMVTLQVQ